MRTEIAFFGLFVFLFSLGVICCRIGKTNQDMQWLKGFGYLCLFFSFIIIFLAYVTSIENPA